MDYYVLQWLQQWVNDDTSLLERRLVKEVTPRHTFCIESTAKCNATTNDGKDEDSLPPSRTHYRCGTGPRSRTGVGVRADF